MPWSASKVLFFSLRPFFLIAQQHWPWFRRQSRAMLAGVHRDGARASGAVPPLDDSSVGPVGGPQMAGECAVPPSGIQTGGSSACCSTASGGLSRLRAESSTIIAPAAWVLHVARESRRLCCCLILCCLFLLPLVVPSFFGWGRRVFLARRPVSSCRLTPPPRWPVVPRARIVRGSRRAASDRASPCVSTRDRCSMSGQASRVRFWPDRERAQRRARRVPVNSAARYELWSSRRCCHGDSVPSRLDVLAVTRR
jgi:hypothetical protein